MPIPTPPLPIPMRAPEDEIGLVQGVVPESKNEWYVSLALDKLQLEYSYQYPLGGGRALRGGQVVDFVVWTAIGGIPVFVQGAYWHSARRAPEDVLKQAAAGQYFRHEAVLLEEEETSTRDKALVAVREKVQI